ncbi:LysR substrate-binding domain-containing protein [Octadecabacter sp. G9-8]|uniref:LysR substrate-binding domain-containing protein n=1 Tax=Octadecabacter dasysiphoniae TaxID=2909341 RepID=A0ABS9CZ60_9RHOB|nr:LysR substrate-binding domain-containing protein [Octadecabacter dasysiphoniae]MCF2872562.1 LysR substrate-binding domain-containing protein [Octadecabacter dasysiphoniae]
MTNRPRLRQLEALKSVADHGTMTRAAHSLEISQPAVSRLLADLSDELGFALLDRKDGRLVPTQEARYILPDIARVLEMMKNITDTSQNLNARTAGHLRVACLPGFATSHLPDVVTDFLTERRDVTLTLEPDRPERILEWIIGEQYDCGITDSFGGHPAIDSNTLDIRTVCIFPTGHPFEALDSVGPEHLDGQRFIHTRRDSSFYQDLADVFRKAAVTPHSFVETRQFTAACELVMRGLGVSVVSELDARTYQDRLRYRPFTPNVPHQISIVRPIHKIPSKITLDFMETFERSLSDLIVGPDT